MAGDYEYFAAQAMPQLCILACIFDQYAQQETHAFLAVVAIASQP